jgi:hypothetical protein
MNDLRIKHLLIALAAAGPAACIGSNSGSSPTPGDACSHVTYYKDADGDGFGDPNSFITGCAGTIPMGYSPSFEDCDDTRADVFPGATDVCDGVMNDCRMRLGADAAMGDGPLACNPNMHMACAFAGAAQGHNYVVCSDNETWTGASNLCGMLPGNGHLADVNQPAEEQTLASFFGGTFGSTPAWIYPNGVQDPKLLTWSWQCISGSNQGCGYTNWPTGTAPLASDPMKTKPNCAQLQDQGPGVGIRWNAVDCAATTSPYICEIDPSH